MPDTPQITIRQRMEALLVEHFSPSHLDIRDDSHRHAGHSGSHADGETHFRVTIVSSAFSGLSRVARQRKVNTALKPLLEARIHALQLAVLTPEEFTNS